MTITSTVVVTRGREDVWSFLTDLRNTPTWDRSIAHAALTSGGPIGIGAIGETTSPGGKHQSFRVVVFAPPRLLTFRLLRSPLFRLADLTFRLEAVEGGTRITHEIAVQLRLWLFFLSPVFTRLGRRALSTDLDYLRRALDEGLDLTKAATPH